MKSFLLCILAAAMLVTASAEPLDGIAVLPDKIILTGPEARQRLITLNLSHGNHHGEAANPSYLSSNPDVVTIDSNGLASARSNGDATITVQANGHTTAATIKVKDFDQPHTWNFRNHVLPIMSRAGCNQGACHGALAGKGGFRLSLRGYDPVTDHQRITREAVGRRVELSSPAHSLILTKPTTAVKHKGGKRIDPGSRDYRILAEWIAQGTKPPAANDAQLKELELLPARSVLKPGDTQHLILRATYSDGRTEDVTEWAKFTSTDETVAQVDEATGQVSVIGYGEGAITAWFSSQIVLARVTSPFTNNISPQQFARLPNRNFIDELNLAQLRALNLLPSPRSTDAEFIRRVFLDSIGVLPSPQEVRTFLASAEPDKREVLIDQLLERDEYVDYWTYRFSDMFLINSRLLRPNAVKAYYQWLRGQVAKNTPWDQLVRGVVTAKGGSIENGASNFYAVHQDPETMAENVSQAFLSLSIGCAKCHNHPLEKWTNDQYYSFANLFARVRAKGWGGDPRSGNGIRTLYVADHGDLIQPRTGKPQPPAPLDAAPLASDDRTDRREHLADWLTSPDNPYFTRSIANRIWAACMTKGLVEPVDDLRISNPPSNEALLNKLATYLVENDYNLKALLRLILNSETYQRSSEPLPQNRDDQRNFSRYYPRRLMAELLHDAIASVTDVPAEFTNTALTDGSKEKTDFYPKGTRALELFDSAVDSYFLRTFGRNPRAITCECERSNQPSMVQVLHLSNGSTLNDRLEKKESRITYLLKSGINDSQLIETAYLWCLSRLPTDHETSGFSKILNETNPDKKREVVEDLFWALMTSREFLFQH